MKIDHEYLKELLEAFESAKKATTDINDLSKAGFDYSDEKFIFHIEILSDSYCIESCYGRDLGFVRGVDGHLSWGVVPLRLTAKGHEFLESIRNEEVWSKIKNEFKDSSIDTIFSVSKDLFDGFLKKKVTELLDLS